MFVKLLEAIAAAERWSLEYVPGTWAEGLDRLEAGQIDLMPDVAWTAARARVYAFHTEPVMSDWFQIYARRGSGIRSLVDLDGKRIALLERSVQQEAFESAIAGFGLDVTLTLKPDCASAFAAVARGDADAVITNRYYGVAHAPESGLQETAIVFHPTALYFAAPKVGHEGILEAIDRHLIRMKADPASVYYCLLDELAGHRHPHPLPAWIKLVALLVAALLVASIALNLALRRRAAARAAEFYRQQMVSAQLMAARERAEEADRIKSAFLAAVSHELRTPLNSIIGFTGILLQGLAGPLNEEQTKQLGMVQSSARHLLSLINDVLDISRIEAGQLDIHLEPFDVREVVEKVAKSIGPLAEKKGLRALTEVSPGVGTLTSDKRRVEQILLNLMSNAVKFTERGEVTLSCAVEERYVVFRVRDTGIGIEARDMPKLFAPFHQIDSGTTRQHEGTGLGLAISKRLTEALGGAIEVSSELGKGSTFKVSLPMEPGAEP